MPEDLLLELENDDTLTESVECLAKIEVVLRDAMREVGRIAERMMGTARTFDNTWRQIVAKVAKGQTAKMQAARPSLLSVFETRLDILKQTHALLIGYHKHDWTELPNPDDFLSEIAGMERLKARVFDPWQTAEDLEDLAARDYPLTTSDLERFGPQHRPPASWYTEEDKLF